MGEFISGLEICRVTYKWTIEEFSFWLDAAENEDSTIVLDSPKFSPGDINKSHWRIDIEINGKKEENKSWISIFAVLVDCEKNDVKATINFWIIDDQLKKKLLTSTQAIQTYSPDEDENNSGFSQFCKKDKLRQNSQILMPNNKLTIGGKVIVYGLKDLSKKNQLIIPSCDIVNDYRKLYESKEYTDVMIILNGTVEFKAHKAVLSARCPVFSAIFQSDMKENMISLDDIKDEIFEKILKFIYTDDIPSPEEINTDLLTAAHKFKLEKLKNICEHALCDVLTVANVAEVLTLTDCLAAEQLKTFAINFINDHKADVLESSRFQAMEKTHPNLVVMLYRQLSAIKSKINCESLSDNDEAPGNPVGNMVIFFTIFFFINY